MRVRSMSPLKREFVVSASLIGLLFACALIGGAF